MTETISVTGFNGEYQDGVLHQYILGNGYRAYNPTLQRFTCPDSMSPFGKGGINPYAYCAGDPINNTDPTGHFIVALLASMILTTVAGAAVDAAVGAVVEGGAIAAGVAAGAAEAGGAAEATGAEAVEAVGYASARDALRGNTAGGALQDFGVDGMPEGAEAGPSKRAAIQKSYPVPILHNLNTLNPDQLIELEYPTYRERNIKVNDSTYKKMVTESDFLATARNKGWLTQAADAGVEGRFTQAVIIPVGRPSSRLLNYLRLREMGKIMRKPVFDSGVSLDDIIALTQRDNKNAMTLDKSLLWRVESPYREGKYYMVSDIKKAILLKGNRLGADESHFISLIRDIKRQW